MPTRGGTGLCRHLPLHAPSAPHASAFCGFSRLISGAAQHVMPAHKWQEVLEEAEPAMDLLQIADLLPAELQARFADTLDA